ncbi:hypothetical protein B5V01_16310 [Mesorhizobium erdmanii]|uniref:Uncharacterized protein n=1 Tax=Mesorhizobium erdmanii TaxID=1777866 RepID=A0A4Q1V3G8_9HYPH|nr:MULTISPECIES: hypothetical protein [Mesorhizobium]RXT44704.1 hypothetical protein B5V01_16310 [Mesorhizobium erdmanii]
MTLKIDSLQITPEILALVSEIGEFKGAWRALGTLAPDRLDTALFDALRPVMIWADHASGRDDSVERQPARAPN